MTGLFVALISALAACGGVIVAFLFGRKTGRQKAENTALRDQIDTRKEIDDATVDNDLYLADRFLNRRVRDGEDRD